MVGKRVAAGPTLNDAISCADSVKEAFHDEPAKIQDFLDLLEDLLARRWFQIGDQASLLARGGQIFKDHPNLLFGLNAFLPADFQIFVPPEPDQPTELPDNIERKRDDAELNKIKVNVNNTVENLATEPTVDDATSYLTSVRETLHGDPAKFKEFIKLLGDLKAGRVHVASFIARAQELFKDHPKLLSGLNVFLPDQAKIFIPPKPKLPDNIEIKRYDADALLEVSSYVTAVLEAFHGEPAKCKDFFNFFSDLSAKRSLFRVDPTSLHERAGELFKDHPNLLSGLNAFLPAEAKIIFPPEPEQPTDDPLAYILAVKEALHGEPAIYKDFLTLLEDHFSRRVDEASFLARAEQIFKDHPNLLPGLSVLLPDEATIYRIISPEPEQPTELPDKHKDAEHFLNMIKTRFQRLDTQVPSYFVKVMEDFKEGKKSEEEVREEVLDLLYYHEDLRLEFLKLLQ